jgi:hypothetical protein
VRKVGWKKEPKDPEGKCFYRTKEAPMGTGGHEMIVGPKENNPTGQHGHIVINEHGTVEYSRGVTDGQSH